MSKTKALAMILGTVLVSAVLTGCPATMSVREFRIADQSGSAISWDRVFANPQEIKIITLKTGEIQVPRGFVLINLQALAASGLEDGLVWVDVYAHLIRHKVNGDYLIDTGYDKTFSGNSSGNLECWVGLGLSFKQEQGQDIKSQLEKHNANLQAVFFTHLHGDHSSGVPDLPKDVSYVAGKGEMEAYMVFHIEQSGCVNQLEGVKNSVEVDFSSAMTMPPMGKVIDIFGDGSLWALSTMGHSPSHISYLVNGKDGPVLLTGDASHTKWGFDNNVEPALVVDREAAQRSLAQLREFAGQFPSIKVIYGHEPGFASAMAQK